MLEIDKRHTQAIAVDFTDYVVEKCPCRIRTDRATIFSSSLGRFASQVRRLSFEDRDSLVVGVSRHR